jgi:hypothetical protein
MFVKSEEAERIHQSSDSGRSALRVLLGVSQSGLTVEKHQQTTAGQAWPLLAGKPNR